MRNLLFVGAVALAFFPAGASAQSTTTIKSNYCKNLFGQMSGKPAFKAFALSSNGRLCHAVWGSSSQEQANREAKAGCEGNGRSCLLISIR